MKLIECNKGDFVLLQVQSGDSINSILQTQATTLNNIIRNNSNIDLYEGEVFKILTKTNIYHIVKPMENLKIIAQKYNTNIDEIIKLNNLTSTRLFIGQTLKIKN